MKKFLFFMSFLIFSISLFNFANKKKSILFSKNFTRSKINKKKKSLNTRNNKHVTIMIKNGKPKNRLDIVILGDGYIEKDNLRDGNFEKHSKAFIKTFFNTPPFKKHKNKFSIYRIKSISKERGADPSIKDTVNTLFNSAYGEYGIKRALVTRNTNQLVKYLLKAPECDLIIVMVNSKRHGGSSSKIKTVMNGKSGVIPVITYSAGYDYGIQTALHEMGHSIANLADEYVDKQIADMLIITNVNAFPNIDTNKDPKKTKWSIFLRMHSNASSVIGAFEGAYYHKRGYYRPQRKCKMRHIESSFCHICQKALIRAIFRICGDNFDEIQYHRDNPIP